MCFCELFVFLAEAGDALAIWPWNASQRGRSSPLRREARWRLGLALVSAWGSCGNGNGRVLDQVCLHARATLFRGNCYETLVF